MNEAGIIDTIAADLGVREETRKKWSVRRRVPYRWRLPILQEAHRRMLNLDPTVFDEFRCRSTDRQAERAA